MRRCQSIDILVSDRLDLPQMLSFIDISLHELLQLTLAKKAHTFLSPCVRAHLFVWVYRQETGKWPAYLSAQEQFKLRDLEGRDAVDRLT